MHWKLDLNQKYKNIQVTIQAPEMTNNITKLTTFIDQMSRTFIVKKDRQQIEIDLLSVIYIENIERMTFIYTDSDIYEVDLPLYELEKELERFGFIRINKQTLLNPRSIKSVKALLNSRFELLLGSGEKLIVTRRYRNTFKSLFTKGGLYDA